MVRKLAIERRTVLKSTGSAILLGGIAGLTAADDNTSDPVVEELEAEEVGRSGNVDVDWQVRDPDGALDRVRLVVRCWTAHDDWLCDTKDIDVNGETASGDARLDGSRRADTLWVDGIAVDEFDNSTRERVEIER